MKYKGNILIVDDNEEILLAMKLALSEYFEKIILEKNPNRIPSYAENKNIDIYILDMNFKAGQHTGNEGIYWMNRILDSDPSAIIILITAYGDIELSVKAIKQGATDFIPKPWDDDKLIATVISSYKLRRSKLEIDKLKSKQKHLSETISEQYMLLTGKSKVMRKMWNMIQKVAKTDANILILGENGTGKELVAREIHRLSKRNNEIFVKVDLAALSETLFESELFGHKKGAYTDAREERTGRFELAGGGTLFLDEIGNISVNQQSKLLSVLQNRIINKIGSNVDIPVDIRLICATNKPLIDYAKNGKFREDLLYRINTIQIDIPSLRERKEDIPLFVDLFLARYASKYHKQDLAITRQAIEKLLQHSWPGNIRELEHVVEKAVIMSEAGELTDGDFLLAGETIVPSASLNLEDNEKYLIMKALERSNGNQSMAAKELGVTRKTLYNKIRKYGI